MSTTVACNYLLSRSYCNHVWAQWHPKLVNCCTARAVPGNTAHKYSSWHWLHLATSWNSAHPSPPTLLHVAITAGKDTEKMLITTKTNVQTIGHLTSARQAFFGLCLAVQQHISLYQMPLYQQLAFSTKIQHSSAKVRTRRCTAITTLSR